MTVPALEFVVEIVCIGIVFVPDAVKPEIPAVAVAVHDIVAVVGLEVKLTSTVEEPEHIVCESEVFVMVGASLMVKDLVAVVEGPQSLVTIRDKV